VVLVGSDSSQLMVPLSLCWCASGNVAGAYAGGGGLAVYFCREIRSEREPNQTIEPRRWKDCDEVRCDAAAAG